MTTVEVYANALLRLGRQTARVEELYNDFMEASGNGRAENEAIELIAYLMGYLKNVQKPD